jgi:hypothetical protein
MDGSCLLRFAGLPGQALEVHDSSASGIGTSTSFGIDAAEAKRYTMQADDGEP